MSRANEVTTMGDLPRLTKKTGDLAVKPVRKEWRKVLGASITAIAASLSVGASSVPAATVPAPEKALIESNTEANPVVKKLVFERNDGGGMQVAGHESHSSHASHGSHSSHASHASSSH